MEWKKRKRQDALLYLPLFRNPRGIWVHVREQDLHHRGMLALWTNFEPSHY